MRILFLAHRVPFPPDKGDKIRSFHLLHQLTTALGHDVDLVAHVDDVTDLRHQEVLESFCHKVRLFPLDPWVSRLRGGLALLRGASLTTAWMTRPEAKRYVRGLMEERPYDLIVGYSSQVGAYLVPGDETPVIFDYVDVDSAKHAQYARQMRGPAAWIHGLEGRALRGLERKVARHAARVVVTTPREAAVFRERVGGGEVVSITNGVKLPKAPPERPQTDRPVLLFVGQMDYEPNVRAVEIGALEVLPLVRERFPKARFRICGRRPDPRVRALEGRPGVEVTGEVPDLGPHFAEASLGLIPLPVVRGIQNKVLETLSQGLCVVAFPEVARCLEPGAEAATFCGETAADLARHCIELLGDRERRLRAGEAGRAYVREHHDWDGVGRRWAELIAEVVPAAGRGT